MLKHTYAIGGKIAEDIKSMEHGYDTSDGIKMLGLLEDGIGHNLAGNNYLSALETIKELLEELNKSK